MMQKLHRIGKESLYKRSLDSFQKQLQIPLADEAIGIAQPVSILVDTQGTGKLPDDRIAEIVSKVFDFTPGGIIKKLDLRRPIFRKTAAYGHFGREDADFTWEKTDMVDALKAEAGL